MKSYLYKHIIIIVGTVLLSGIHGTSEEVYLTNLRCEMLVNPEGIDISNPRLSWEISSGQRNTVQTAYQVIVASTPEKLTAGEGDLWNSGIVKIPLFRNFGRKKIATKTRVMAAIHS